MALHELPLERRYLHGHFSRELEPVLEIDSGDTIAFATLDAGWGLEPPRADGAERERFEPRDPELDAGHALIGPVAVRGARAGQVLEVGIGSVRVGSFGLTVAGGWSSFLNDGLDVAEGESAILAWELDADAALGRDRAGREVRLVPFLGVLGMPPDEPGVHPTGPPRFCGGNLDCKELVPGSTLFLPIPLDGALFSAGDCHALQGDGEVSSTAIECPLERAELTLSVRDDFELTGPVALTADAWIALGLGESLNDATVDAVDSMLAADGAGARARAPRRARAGQRRRRPADHAGRQRRDGRPRRAASRRARLGKNLGVAYEFKLPDLGEGLTEGEIARWLVAEGQEIAEDDPLVEVQTDKTTVEIPSPAAGKVARILVGEGDVVPVGTVLVVIGEDGAAPAVVDEQPRAEPAPAAAEPRREPAARVRATPLIRRMAQELGVDLETVEGSGPQGRITEDDVRRSGAGERPTKAGASRCAASAAWSRST